MDDLEQSGKLALGRLLVQQPPLSPNRPRAVPQS